MKNLLKVEIYDEFSCIADECTFTCCKGWEITVDADTYHSWNCEGWKTGDLIKNIKMKKSSEKPEYIINIGKYKRCPFLDEIGLCNIVKERGEDFLPKTCKRFPRQENKIGDFTEYSLTCACPAVVDLINRMDAKIKLLQEGDSNIADNMPPEYIIREIIITIIQDHEFSLRDKVLLAFQILLMIKSDLEITSEVKRRYHEEDYLLSFRNLWRDVPIDHEASYEETSELFLDIVQNYRKEKNYSIYLQEIYELAEDLDMDEIHTVWKHFKEVYCEYDKLMENCMVAKIFSDCINDDIDEMIMSFQKVITEYTMVRYSAFLKWIMDEGKEITYNDTKNYIVVYSRIIGYNTNGMIEFWEDSFEEPIWELGYLFLLIS